MTLAHFAGMVWCVSVFKATELGLSFAETPQTAKRLLDSLAASVAGQEFFIDVPTVNAAALQFGFV